MGARRRFYILVSSVIVSLIAAIVLRSTLVAAVAPEPSLFPAWREDFLSTESAAQIVTDAGGSYFLVLASSFGEVAYFGLTTEMLKSGAELHRAKLIAEDMRPTVLLVTRNNADMTDFLPSELDIKTVNVTMSEEDELAILRGRFGEIQTSLFLAIRAYWNAVDRDQLTADNADRFLMTVKRTLSLTWPGETVESFDQYWRKRYPNAGEWRDSSRQIMDAKHGSGILQEISAFMSQTYKMHTIHVIAGLVTSGERVVAIADPMEIAQMEPVLRIAIGLPLYPKSFLEDHAVDRNDKANKIQPTIIDAPPSGVIAPSHNTPVSDIK